MGSNQAGPGTRGDVGRRLPIAIGSSAASGADCRPGVSRARFQPAHSVHGILAARNRVFVTKLEVSALGLVHALREMGLPFFFTRGFDQALTHPLVLIYPEIDGDSLTMAQADQLRAHVEQGGTAFAQNIFWRPLKPIFGFYKFDPSRR